MPARKKGLPAALVLAAAAITLMAVPRCATQTLRIPFLLALIPLRNSAAAAVRILRGFLPHGSPSTETLQKIEYYQGALQALQARNAELQARIDDLAAVRNVLPDRKLNLLPATVIVNADANIWRRTLLVARGTSEGARCGQLVLWGRHLVGRVIAADAWTCRVQLTSDPGFKTRAVVTPTDRDAASSLSQRDICVFEGDGERAGILKWLSSDARIEPGALVVTSADPERGMLANLVLGRVDMIARSRGLGRRVRVHPFVDAAVVESVVIVLGTEP